MHCICGSYRLRLEELSLEMPRDELGASNMTETLRLTATIGKTTTTNTTYGIESRLN
jgi:hypothetical protein